MTASRFSIVSAMLFFVAGCVASGSAYVDSGNEFTVSVNWSEFGAQAGDALAVADEHCAQFGKRARLRDAGAGTFVRHYDCIEPSLTREVVPPEDSIGGGAGVLGPD